MKKRGFEVTTAYQDKNINLPKRATKMRQDMILKLQRIS